ncbi:RagB/SusD family nutrient uptake outer membrane protein [Pedobacter sp. KLB.chiD]|uniref:RagB/SusD family nutrient uptake outer membrane protein n=1 Tax=Pedobacter sp. KLB.chiD TaxID=3387402 RepID=UPI00399AECE0
MNTKAHISICLILLCTICLSCEKLIEVELPNNQIISSQVFQDTQTADAALANLYAGLRDTAPLAGTANSTGALLGTYTDDLDSFSPVANSVYDIFQNQQLDTNIILQSYWASTYQLIYRANAIIEGIETSIAIPQNDKNRIKGEALLIRSILHFYLHQIYGDIPYVTITDYQINKSLSKTAETDVLPKIENDLNQSVALLADAYRNSERIYLNKKVAELMLAKIYLLQNRNADAESVLKNIVQSPLYQFENDINKVFLKTGGHILWQLKPANSGDPTKEALTYYFSGAAPSGYALSQNLLNIFAATDLRKINWMASVTVGSNTWYRANKYKNRTNNNTEYSIVFRLEEVYLLLAETLVKQNKLVEALPYVNATRSRAGLTTLINVNSQSTLLNEILLESRKEFFTEMGHRFLDLKRYGRLSDLTSAKPNWKTYHNRWPLPQKELLLNSNLNPQNPGY